MKRINDYTVHFDPGDMPIPELGWWVAQWPSHEPYRAPPPPRGSFLSNENNVWLRKVKWNLRPNGLIDVACRVAAPKEVIDLALAPKQNEWGEVHP